MVNINIYSPCFFERWSWRNSTEGGIGGSETAHTEWTWRLAARGHHVTSYCPLPGDRPEFEHWRDSTWLPIEKVDFQAPGLWIVFRSAQAIDDYPDRDDQKLWLLLQDIGPMGELTPERAAKVDRVICLCEKHAKNVARDWPIVKDRISISSNGIKRDLIESCESVTSFIRNNPRNPRRLIYASSLDRGLLPLLKIFRRAREYVSDLTLDVFYGTDNMQAVAKEPKFKYYAKMVEAFDRAGNQPGVTMHGRVSQRQLVREMLSAGIWCYPNTYSETSCIQSMEQQACGAIPITRPYFALAENVQHGVLIQGDPEDGLVQARYVDAVVKVAMNPDAQEKIRGPMMAWARERFDWEKVVDQLEGWL